MAPLRKYFDALLAHYGPPKWWPADSPFEVMVGAILTQNTSWKNVEKAIHNLKVYDLLDARKLHELDQDTVAMAIKPAGTFNVKAARLKGFVAWFLDRYQGDLSKMKEQRPERLREELLEVKGIGPETADAILLYSAGRPVFVADAYARRLLAIHGFLPDGAGYEDARAFLEAHLPSDPALFNELHALMVAAGKEHSRRAGRRSAPPRRGSPPPAPARPSPSSVSGRRAGRAPARPARRR